MSNLADKARAFDDADKALQMAKDNFAILQNQISDAQNLITAAEQRRTQALTDLDVARKAVQ